MAAPFDKFPSVRTYLQWAHSEGCVVNEGVRGKKKIYKITATDGRFVAFGSIPDGEGLSPSMVSHLDRRLGVKSPFPKAPEPYS